MLLYPHIVFTFYNSVHIYDLLLSLLHSPPLHNIQREYSYRDNYLCNILYIERECWIPCTFISYFAIYIIYERRDTSASSAVSLCVPQWGQYFTLEILELLLKRNLSFSFSLFCYDLHALYFQLTTFLKL